MVMVFWAVVDILESLPLFLNLKKSRSWRQEEELRADSCRMRNIRDLESLPLFWNLKKKTWGRSESRQQQNEKYLGKHQQLSPHLKPNKSVGFSKRSTWKLVCEKIIVVSFGIQCAIFQRNHLECNLQYFSFLWLWRCVWKTIKFDRLMYVEITMTKSSSLLKVCFHLVN